MIMFKKVTLHSSYQVGWIGRKRLVKKLVEKRLLEKFLKKRLVEKLVRCDRGAQRQGMKERNRLW